jgi:pilus assembly protein CpaB
MNKKIIRTGIGLIALIAVVLIGRTQEAKRLEVIAARHDLPEGYTITSEDIEEVELPTHTVPQGAFTDAADLVGETLSVPRSAQDVILRSHLGGTELELAPGERAVGVEVADSAGLAGLLKAGDQVGVNAVIETAEGSYSKVIADGLRVLYISPSFLAKAPEVEAEDEKGALGTSGIDQPREEEGVVILAVPVQQHVIAYDFSAFGVEGETRAANVIELLSAFDHSPKVKLSLFMDPEDREDFLTAGVHIPDLVVEPKPSPTPEPTPTGMPGEEASP